MSAAAVLRAAVLAELAADSALTGLAVFDAPPVRSLVPHAVVEEPMLAAFDAAGVTGRIGTLAIGFRDEGEVPVRLRILMAIAEEAVDLMPGALADGWRIGGLALARSRLARVKDPSTGSGQVAWLGRAEWAVRIFRTN